LWSDKLTTQGTRPEPLNILTHKTVAESVEGEHPVLDYSGLKCFRTGSK